MRFLLLGLLVIAGGCAGETGPKTVNAFGRRYARRKSG